jgi:Subtilase family
LRPRKPSAKSGGKFAGGHDPDWPPLTPAVWHLDDTHSQLRSARAAVAGSTATVRIGHLDTGHSRKHPAIPERIYDNKLQRNFIDDEDARDAEDRLSTGTMKQPGHGPATVSLLAGGHVEIEWQGGGFREEIGGAPFADVVCCRVAKSVVLIKSSAFADALDYLTGLAAVGSPVHVVSMSMGGAPSRAWADAVNAAYLAGITVVTAAGNHYKYKLLNTPHHVIYPARWERVLAACGATQDHKRYSTDKHGEMQGNYGPAKHMDRALGAYTPNTPWANMKSLGFDLDGAGTSSATPQIAAAAAIYYRKYFNELQAMSEPWRRVEAIRNALFQSARKQGQGWQGHFGNGILRANDALAIAPRTNLAQAPKAEMPWFPILDTIFKVKPKPALRAKLEMFNTELAQLVYDDPLLSRLAEDRQGGPKTMLKAEKRRFAEAIVAHPGASLAIKDHLKKHL